MSKIIRHEFMGSWVIFWLLCLPVITIPYAILYLMSCTITLETEVNDPERFADAFRESRELKNIPLRDAIFHK